MQTNSHTPSIRWLASASALFLSVALVPTPASAQQQVGMGIELWGANQDGQCTPPALPSGVHHVQVACGIHHTLSLLSNGSVRAWGSNEFGQCNAPMLSLGHVYARIAASDHSLGLVDGGPLLAWGRNDHGQCDVPVPAKGETFVAVAAGNLHSAGLTSDGQILCWGDNSSGQCKVPQPASGLSYAAVAAGGRHTVGLLSDGSVVAWGANFHGQCDLPPAPEGHKYVEIAAGFEHTLARLDDGTLVASGDNSHGQSKVPGLLAGQSFVQIAAGGSHDLARLNDGSILAWGDESAGLNTLPGVLGNADVVLISAGAEHSAVLFQSEPPAWTAFCFGDGSVDSCPCHNDSLPSARSGCSNSTGRGGKLDASGHARLGSDDLKLFASDLPLSVGMLVQGTAMSAGDAFPFAKAAGAGLTCLRGAGERLIMRPLIGGTFKYPAAGETPLSKLGLILSTGPIAYQLSYRDTLADCAFGSFNYTNALNVVWSE